MQARHLDTETRKHAKRYSPATWLGRELETNQYLCALDARIMATRPLRRVPQEQRCNCLVDAPFPWKTLDGEESRNDIVRCLAPIEGLATEPAAPPPAPLPERNLPLPRARFGEKRIAEAADLKERDTKAISNVRDESMGDEIDCDNAYTETDTISPAELAARRYAEMKKMLTLHKSLPQDAPHRDLPVIALVPRGECWVDKRGPDGKVQCRTAMHGFKIRGTDRLAVRHNSVASHTAAPFDRGGSAMLGCRVRRTVRYFVCCLHPLGDLEILDRFGVRSV